MGAHDTSRGYRIRAGWRSLASLRMTGLGVSASERSLPSHALRTGAPLGTRECLRVGKRGALRFAQDDSPAQGDCHAERSEAAARSSLINASTSSGVVS